MEYSSGAARCLVVRDFRSGIRGIGRGRSKSEKVRQIFCAHNGGFFSFLRFSRKVHCTGGLYAR